MQKEKKTDFDLWRTQYDQMSFLDQVAFYMQFKQPGMKGNSLFRTDFITLLRNFLDQSIEPCRMVEIGGDEGQLAQLFMDHPNLGFWHNFDLCSFPQTFYHERYLYTPLTDWVWNLPPFEGFNCVVLSHVLEHLKARDVEKIFPLIANCPHVIMETPLPETKPNWQGYNGSHILEWTLSELIHTFVSHGYEIRAKNGTAIHFYRSPSYRDYPRQTIMVVGWMLPDKMAAGLARSLEKLHHKMIRVSTDGHPLSWLDKADYYVQQEMGEKEMSAYLDQTKRFPVRLALQKFPHVDWIIVVQNTSFEYDMSGVYIPWYYVYHEIVFPDYPHYDSNLATGIFYSFVGAEEWLNLTHKPETTHATFKVTLPYAVDLDLFTSEHLPNKYFAGFRGSLVYPKHGELPFIPQIYSKRNQMITYAHDFGDVYVELRDFQAWVPGSEHTQLKNYKRFLQQCKIGLNISGDYGVFNERMFHIIAAGSVLLQYYSPHIESLGFKHHVNCLFFRTERDILAELNWAKYHPEELERIRQNGFLLVKERHTFDERAKVVLDNVMKYQSKEKNRLLWIKWRKEEYPKENHVKYEVWVKQQK
jgi:hypothetical protein